MTNYTYNMDFMDTSNTMLDIIDGVNNASNGFIGAGIMILLFIGLLSAFMSKNYDFGQSMIITSFICSIISAILFFMSWLAWWIAVIFIVTLIIGILVEAFG